MFFLVGWHYVKQGFGVLVVLAGAPRRSVHPRERLGGPRALLRGLGLRRRANPADPGPEVEEKGVVYTTSRTRLARPRHARASFSPPRSSCSLVVLVQKRRREGRLPLVTPLAALPLQHLVVVNLLQHQSARRLRDPGAALAAVPLFRLAAPRQRGARARGAPLVREVRGRAPRACSPCRRSALGWLLFHGAPAALDGALVAAAPARFVESALGATPYFAALYTFVNIHHFFMD